MLDSRRKKYCNPLTESPLTPKFNVEGALGCVVVQLAIALGVSTSSLGVVFNIEFGGAGGTYARSSSSKLYMQLCRFYVSTGKISSIHRLDGLPSNMQSAYYNCATCMLGM